MSRSDIIREYYGRIDRADTTWVIALFATDAVYQRAETTYLGSSEIKRFFTEERKITGVHTVDEIFMSDEGDCGVETGNC